MIIKLTSFEIENDIVHVEAIVEDAQIVFRQTFWEPAEYGPGLCSTSFMLDKTDSIPIHEPDLIKYLESMSLDWELIPDSETVYDYALT